MKILVTGATGNIGKALIKYLLNAQKEVEVLAASRNIEKDQKTHPPHPKLKWVYFDFAAPSSSFDKALSQADQLFLLRPPAISDVNIVFKPLIEKAKRHELKGIVFLSVQGVEKSSVIPHHKIEALIVDSGIDYIFIRPGYFMQNLTTTLWKDLSQKKEIYLPSGKAKFNWTDVGNIAECSAIAHLEFETLKNKALVITGQEQLNFEQVAQIISEKTGKNIEYRSPNPLIFAYRKYREGLPFSFIMVMIVLHFLPRFQETPPLSSVYEQLTGKKPTTLEDFVEREINTANA